MRSPWLAAWVAVMCAWVPVTPGWAEEEDDGDGDEDRAEDRAEPVSVSAASLDELSLEELLSLDLKVVSASKRAEDLSGASAALYVVTAEEIRRIGALSVPEALRVVPGMHVARADGSSWAVATRSFSGRFNTRMLVLVDGRSVYSPLFGGVFWEQQDTMLSDLDRIEAIRGPGGTLWGVNAVNGVINVISKSAEQTQGLLAVAGGGTEELGFGSVRYGGRVGGLHYRVWTHYHERGPQALADGTPANDDWRDRRAGLRMDWKSASGRNHVTLQGDAHQQRAESTYVYDIPEEPFLVAFAGDKHRDGHYALGRWRHTFSESLGAQVQSYFDVGAQDGSAAQEWRQTADVDVQVDWRAGGWSTLVVGAGFRTMADRWENRPDGEFLQLDPLEAREDILNFYAQEEVSLFAERLRLTVGSKLERNDFTGLEIQPSVRASFRIDDHWNVWAAASRAVKTPARLFRDGRYPVGYYFFPGTDESFRIFVEGSDELRSEELIAVEGGIRAELFEAVGLDLAVFHNRYRDLVQPNRDPAVARFEDGAVYIPFENLDDGEVWGAELSAKWNVNDRLAFAGGWSHHRANLGPSSTTDEKSAPATMANLRLYMNLAERVEWNIAGYYYDVSGRYDPELLRGNDLVVDPVRRIDMGVTLRPAKRVEVALWGQNLTDARHLEAKEGLVTPTTYVERGFYARVTSRFF